MKEKYTFVFWVSTAVSTIALVSASRMYVEDQRLIDDTEKAKGIYEKLLLVADKDKNGSLSSLEKTLLLERINRNKGNISGTSYPEYNWTELKEPTAWDKHRLEETLKVYKKEAPEGI